MSEPTTKKARSDGVDEQLAINVIRMLSADMPSHGNSGHPGAPVGCAPMAHVLWKKTMKYNPKNEKWPNRDRFVLSNGHACALQYSMLHLTGYDLPMEELKKFRQLGSKTPGHPEAFLTPGIEVCTGPLGQGISNAVGLAIAEAHMAATFNKEGFPIVDNYTYVICGDGCLQEGVASEACSLAGHLGLGKLIVLYDDNSITIDGDTQLSFTEDVLKRFEAYGWHTSSVEDGDKDVNSIEAAVKEAKEVTDKPSIIKIRTTIGLGSATQGTKSAHGSPFKADDLANTKKYFGLPPDKTFYVPDDVAEYYNHVHEGARAENEWHELFKSYADEYPDLAAEFTRRLKGELPKDWKKSLPKYSPGDKAKATRQLSQESLNALCNVLPEVIGGSADLTSSNLTFVDSSSDFQKSSPLGRYLRFGVREHGMAAISNGICAYGGIIPFCATFLNFLTYAWGAARLSALGELGVIYVMTHDSIGLGEDGPTHQPIEVLSLCRATPQMYTFRPADGNEVAGSYACAIENRQRPAVLALSRHGVPQLDGSSIEAVAKGAYVLQEHNMAAGEKPELIIVATGTEVSVAVESAKKLEDVKVRVVSMPCMELFEEQDEQYRRQVFPCGVPSLAVEASSSFGWDRYSHDCIGMRSFGLSGPLKGVLSHFGYEPERVAQQARGLLEFFQKREVPSLIERPKPFIAAAFH